MSKSVENPNGHELEIKVVVDFLKSNFPNDSALKLFSRYSLFSFKSLAQYFQEQIENIKAIDEYLKPLAESLSQIAKYQALASVLKDLESELEKETRLIRRSIDMHGTLALIFIATLWLSVYAKFINTGVVSFTVLVVGIIGLIVLVVSAILQFQKLISIDAVFDYYIQLLKQAQHLKSDKSVEHL